ncbi:hypothetical protein Tco_0798522 [Tanacetum coccineum]
MVCYALSVFASGLAAVVDSDSPSGSVFRLPLFSQVFAISNIRVSVHNMGIPHVKAPAKEYRSPDNPFPKDGYQAFLVGHVGQGGMTLD